MAGKRLALLGSTGSIGVNVLDVVRTHSDKLSVFGLSAGRNWEKLAGQIQEFRPQIAVISDPTDLPKLRERLHGCDTTLLAGMEGNLELAAATGSDVFVSAVVGSIGLRPVLQAIQSRKAIALANKETLVMAGALVMESARTAGVPILPIDSEHSAIFQCLNGNASDSVKRLILTASGGPFRRKSASELAFVTPAEALKHPNWDMGGKITIDSATLMNKGLEVIEAHWLFDMPFSSIDVVIHPQSIIHSMIEFIDGSVLGQMGAPDMRGPIQYALSHPDRWTASAHGVDFLALGSLTFEAPRRSDFPCLDLAYQAGQRGGTLPCVMNAANEIAVAAFLEGRIGFLEIPRVIQQSMTALPFAADPTLAALLATDQAARECARQHIVSLSDPHAHRVSRTLR
jgi:1-deoxy-D-xylulose-5-phosphate reductoisomerase